MATPISVHVTLRHGGIDYDFFQRYGEPHPVTGIADDDPIHGARYMWEEGNFDCDCNRSLFIGEHCDASFPEMECGEDIKLISLTVDDKSILDRDSVRERASNLGLWIPRSALAG